jgi:hypothetical protein
MGGFLGTAGPLANLLGFGAPIANTAGGIIQNTQNVRQRNASEQSFINMVDQMGPEYAWAQNWLKQAGPRAVPDVAAALGGPKAVGDMFQRQAMLEQIAPILNDPTLSNEEVAKQIYAKTGDPELLEKLWGSFYRSSGKEPFLTTDEKLTAIQSMLPSAPKQIQGLLQAAMTTKDRALVDLAYKELFPAFGSAAYASQFNYRQIGSLPDGTPIMGLVSTPKIGEEPGTVRPFVSPPDTGGGRTSGVPVPPAPGAAPSPGEEGGDEGAAAAPEASATPGGGVTGMAGRALSSALGAYGGALGGAGIGAPTAIPTPGETSIPTEEPTEEETPTPLPTRVPTTVPSETETPTPTPTPIQLAAGEPIPSPTLEAGGPSIPVSVSTPGIGAPPGPFTKGPKTILGPGSAARTPAPGLVYGVPKYSENALKTGQVALRTYISLQGLRRTMEQFSPEEWNRSFVKRWGDYFKIRSAGKSTGDPRIDHLVTLLITVHTQAQQAVAASAGTRSYQALKEARGHIPEGTDEYAKAKADIDNLTSPDGPYVSAMDEAGIQIPGGRPTPYVMPAPAGAATPGAGAMGRDRRTGEVLYWRP